MVLFYIFLVAVLNICLGFGVAVHLGRRHRSAADPVDFGGADAIFGETGAATNDFVEGGAGPATGTAEREKSPSQECVETLQAAVEGYHKQLKEVDSDLRQQVEPVDAAAIELSLVSLMGVIQEFTEGRDAAQERLGELHDGEPEYAEIDAKLRAAIARQDEHITRTCTTVEAFDLDGDLESSCREIVTQTGVLMDDSDALRDTLEEALA